MNTNRMAQVVIAAGAMIASSHGTLADQIGRAAFPSPSARVGGVRMALPTPRINGGRNGPWLNRGGSLLPPSTPRPSRPDMGGGRPMPRPFPGRGGVDTGTGIGQTGDRPMTDGPFYDTGDGRPPGGTRVDGSVETQRFRLRWHVGADCHKPENCYPRYCYPRNYYPYSAWPYYGYGWNWSYSNYPQYVYSGPWYGTDPFVTQGTPANTTATSSTPTTTTAPAPRELTPIERADLAWQSGRLADATRYFKEYLSGAPDDTDAMRFLALVYIDQRKLDEAVALLAMAYERTPQLASRPLPAEDIPGGSDQMRRRVNTISAYANRTKTGSAWLAMTVLVQSEGRETVARNLVDRATKAGLNEKVATELAAAMATN